VVLDRHSCGVRPTCGKVTPARLNGGRGSGIKAWTAPCPRSLKIRNGPSPLRLPVSLASPSEHRSIDGRRLHRIRDVPAQRFMTHVGAGWIHSIRKQHHE